MACEHGSKQALTGFSVVCEQMGNETCSLNTAVISSSVDITTELELWSGSHRDGIDCPGKLWRKGSSS